MHNAFMFTVIWCVLMFGVVDPPIKANWRLVHTVILLFIEFVITIILPSSIYSLFFWIFIILCICVIYTFFYQMKLGQLIIQSTFAVAIELLIIVISSMLIGLLARLKLDVNLALMDGITWALCLAFAILFRNLKLFQRFCEYCRHINSRVATALSIMILAGCCIWALPYQENLLFFYGFLVLIFGICVYVFVSTAKDTIQNKTAQEQFRAKEKELLAAEEKLKEDKAALSQEVHRSSGYIPALKRQLEMQNAETAGELPALKEEVERVKREQQAENRRHVQSTKILPPTGLKLLDLLLKDTTEQCARQDIDFDITVMTPINMLVELDLITETALLRLFGDLLKNAVKAVGKNEPGKRKILVIMGISFEHYQIEFFDNGPPFAKKVLHNFGKRGVTTDGSGHGLADTLEALKPSGGSIVIVEDENDREYTKAIRIIFDALNRVEVCSSRI